ncbi:MAG TPA: N-acetylmuramoyl-L-alanine amidase [Candidatus Dormibacteraeota bacterium]|nr:N-acetylmuramoyl-L-alanine amidase [Candidatus Dormibacteraeota bacterium]
MNPTRGFLDSAGRLSLRVEAISAAASHEKISAILWEVRKSLLPLIFLVAAAACSLAPLHAAQPSSRARAEAFPAASPAQQAPTPAPAPASNKPQLPAAASHLNDAPSPLVPPPVIILDPAHGGTNTGARGESGLVEKDVVLQIARTLQAQLENHGYRVLMTRTDDSNPSYDDRAAIANAYRNAIFITLHVGSTGKIGTVRTYYDEFWTPNASMPSSAQAPTPKTTLKPNAQPTVPAIAKLPANTLISWQQAQRPYVDASHRLADLLQLQFAQTFPGSPLVSSAVPLRDLRSVANPAVAIEIANVSAPSADTILALSGPLSADIEQAIATFRQAPVSETP